MTKWVCNGAEFKVGDSVKVVREVRSHDKDGMGEGVTWENVWADAMTDFISTKKVVKIVALDCAGAELEFDSLSYGYPLSALDKVTESAIVLPEGNFKLIHKNGTVYSVSGSGYGGKWYIVSFTCPLTDVVKHDTVSSRRLLSKVSGELLHIVKPYDFAGAEAVLLDTEVAASHALVKYEALREAARGLATEIKLEKEKA